MKVFLFFITFLCLRTSGQHHPGDGDIISDTFTDDFGDTFPDVGVPPSDPNIPQGSSTSVPGECPSPAYMACKSDVAKYCTEPLNAAEEWLKRCIHDYWRDSFNLDCLEEVAEEWDAIKTERGFDPSFEPMASDVFKIITCERSDPSHDHGKGEDGKGKHGKGEHGKGKDGKGEHEHEREHGEREHGEREHGEREHGEREHGEREHGEREHGEREHGEREHGEHGEREHGGREHGERAHARGEDGERAHARGEDGEREDGEREHGKRRHGRSEYGEDGKRHEHGHGHGAFFLILLGFIFACCPAFLCYRYHKKRSHHHRTNQSQRPPVAVQTSQRTMHIQAPNRIMQSSANMLYPVINEARNMEHAIEIQNVSDTNYVPNSAVALHV